MENKRSSENGFKLSDDLLSQIQSKKPTVAWALPAKTSAKPIFKKLKETLIHRHSRVGGNPDLGISE